MQHQAEDGHRSSGPTAASALGDAEAAVSKQISLAQQLTRQAEASMRSMNNQKGQHQGNFQGQNQGQKRKHNGGNQNWHNNQKANAKGGNAAGKSWGKGRKWGRRRP